MPQRSHIGEIVRLKATDQLAVVISHNCSAETPRTKWRVVARTLDGEEDVYFFHDLETSLSDMETLAFRVAARLKFPDLSIP